MNGLLRASRVKREVRAGSFEGSSAFERLKECGSGAVLEHFFSGFIEDPGRERGCFVGQEAREGLLVEESRVLDDE